MLKSTSFFRDRLSIERFVHVAKRSIPRPDGVAAVSFAIASHPWPHREDLPGVATDIDPSFLMRLEYGFLMADQDDRRTPQVTSARKGKCDKSDRDARDGSSSADVSRCFA